MAAPAFVERLNEQIGHEFSAHQQYIAIATYYDALTMPQMAALFYRQAEEERDHAMMMVQYLLDADQVPVIPALPAPRVSFADVVEPVATALEQEQRVTEQIYELTRIAREHSDFASDQFMQWFIKEQVEEIASMSDLQRIVEYARTSPLLAEEYLARETIGDGGEDPSAPAAAGGAL